MLKKLSRTICFIGLAGISTVAFAHKATTVTADVGFVKIKSYPKGTKKINPIRLKALEEAATTLGARGGLAYRSLQIDNTLKNESSYLNSVFNFNRLLIDKDVLPPVITEAENSEHIASADSIRAASKIYKIVSPARFVSTAPNWRSYLWMSYKKPTLPNHSLLPTTQVEANVWNNYFKQGWKEGLAQANEIFAVNLNRLKRDYTGMIMYKKLLDQHMISSPFVAHTNLGVTGNSNEIRIGDRMSRITENSKLQTDPNKWTPVLTTDGSDSVGTTFTHKGVTKPMK